MEKELKSFVGVLLRADITGMANSANQTISAKKGGMAVPLRTPVQDFNSFSIMFYYIISTIKKLETYFALSYFWTFAQCGLCGIFHFYCLSTICNIIRQNMPLTFVIKLRLLKIRLVQMLISNDCFLPTTTQVIWYHSSKFEIINPPKAFYHQKTKPRIFQFTNSKCCI